MRLPQGEHAIVDLTKLTDYCLSTEHPRGRHKAVVFATKPGFTAEQAALLCDLLKTAAREAEATLGMRDQHGQRYLIDMVVYGVPGSTVVRSAWIIRDGETYPRLIPCYVR